MEIDRAVVLKPNVQVMAVTEFIEQFHAKVTPQSIYYAIENDKIDWTYFGGREKYVVLTEKTRLYIPNGNKNRGQEKPTTTMSLQNL